MKKMKKKENSLVFMDVSIDGDPVKRWDPVKRMVFKLLYNVAPMTAENFRALCTGEKGISQNTGKPLHYKGSFFHQIIKGSIVKGGDFVNRNGTGGESIYGSEFPDESPVLKHDAPGLLSMAIGNRDTLGSHFIITLKADHHLDGNHVVFGKLVHGRDVLRKIGEMGDEEGHPTVIIKIITCGEYSKDRKRVYKSKMGETNNYETRKKGKHNKSSKDRRKRKRYYSYEFWSSSDCDTKSSRSEELWQMDLAMYNGKRQSSDPDTKSSEAEINKSKMGNNGFSWEINKPEMETDGFSAAHHVTLDKGKRLKYAEEDPEGIEIFSESSSDYYNKVSADSDMSSSSGIYS
ncbi:hypothetical protein V8G54_033308 [Vigna mungo]|uniref:peptidylprolyl isomerase n=1 Tax=Vigna mungo TaxID=3915 RepID=A0AAQ3MNM3_VIGMU